MVPFILMVGQSVHLSVSLSYLWFPSGGLSVYLSASSSVCLSVHLSIHPSVLPHVCLCPLVCPSVHLSICLAISLSFFLPSNCQSYLHRGLLLTVTADCEVLSYHVIYIK